MHLCKWRFTYCFDSTSLETAFEKEGLGVGGEKALSGKGLGSGILHLKLAGSRQEQKLPAAHWDGVTVGPG